MPADFLFLPFAAIYYYCTNCPFACSILEVAVFVPELNKTCLVSLSLSWNNSREISRLFLSFLLLVFLMGRRTLAKFGNSPTLKFLHVFKVTEINLV